MDTTLQQAAAERQHDLEAAHRGTELACDGAMRTFKDAAQAMRDAAGY
ncbi:MAG TPA: hypothetical protein VF453_23450 [Burkholderiaceae bacterium]